MAEVTKRSVLWEAEGRNREGPCIPSSILIWSQVLVSPKHQEKKKTIMIVCKTRATVEEEEGEVERAQEIPKQTSISMGLDSCRRTLSSVAVHICYILKGLSKAW